MGVEHLDVVVVGGGLSGISAGYRLQTECPRHSFAILEARQALGGTWDLFRYPGVRSDSDMATLGFPFEPWRGEKAIVEGGDIRDYIEGTARKYGLDKKVRFGHRLLAADWSSSDKRWNLKVQVGEETRQMSCGFLYMGSGYYRYAHGYLPLFPGVENYKGRLIHPQHWPADLDTSDSAVVVIGSGATAVTLIPSLARSSRHVTMLQRSPTYIVGIPSKDRFAMKLSRYLPDPVVRVIQRWRNILYASFVFRLARQQPEKLKGALFARLGRFFSQEEIAEHFTPRYQPWDQRLCFAPDSDFFKALKTDRASIVTGEIDSFTETGIRLRDGRELRAEVVVTATGLVVELFGGARLSIDGRPLEAGEHTAYKGMMLDGIPNLALAIGYTNMSWTLKCDLTARYVCRLLRHMRKRGHSQCAPEAYPTDRPRAPLLDFSSGYVRRGADALPSQGAQAPWTVKMSYLHDLLQLRFGALEDGVMEFR